MNHIVTKGDVSKTIRQARHIFNSGKHVERICVYATPTTERVIYKIYLNDEEIVKEHLLCDISPIFKRYCSEKGYNFEVATKDIYEEVKQAVDGIGGHRVC